jgi:hypothetical protein
MQGLYRPLDMDSEVIRLPPDYRNSIFFTGFCACRHDPVPVELF